MRTDASEKESLNEPVAGPPRATTTVPAGRARSGGEARVRTASRFGFLLLLAIPFAVPTVWMITSSVKRVNEIFSSPPTLWTMNPTLDGYRQVFTFQPFIRQYFNSLYIAVLVTLATLLVSSLAGYAFARIRFPGQNLLFLICLVGLLVPTEVTIVPLFQVFRNLDLINTHVPLIVVPAFGSGAVLGTFIMRQFFVTLPLELEDAARMDGLGRVRIWWQIALPLSRPALSAVAILTFLGSWNMYLEPTVYLTTPTLFTLPQALVRYTDAYGSQMWDVQLAAATLTVVPVLVVFLVAQRQFVEGIAHSGLKG